MMKCISSLRQHPDFVKRAMVNKDSLQMIDEGLTKRESRFLIFWERHGSPKQSANNLADTSIYFAEGESLLRKTSCIKALITICVDGFE
jgi:hypothetical protein